MTGKLLIAALLGALPSQDAAAQVLRRGTLEPHALDPYRSSYLFEQIIESDLYEGLVVFAPDGGVTGGAAARWDVSADGKVLTFHLRPGLRWSNGDPLTAAGFVRGYRRLVDPATHSPNASLAAPIRDVEAPSADVVRITLVAATPYFLSLLTQACFAPLHERSTPSRAVTNGAFVLDEWSRGARIVLKKNPRYWDAARVAIAEVRYLFMPEVSRELRRYFAGDLDVTWDVPAERIAELRAQRPTELQTFPFFGLQYLAFDLLRPPFKDDAKLRLALAMAIDRDRLTRETTGGGELPALSWVPPGLPGYEVQTVDWKDAAREAREATARRLYAEAGYRRDRPLEIVLHRSNTELRRKVCAAIIRQWKEVLGVEAVATSEEWTPSTKSDPSIGHVVATAWNADYADANTFLAIWASTSSENGTGYRNPAFDALLGEAARQPDAGARARLLERAERTLLADMPAIPLYDAVLKKLVRPGVGGFHPNVLGYAYSKDLSLSPAR